MKPYYEHGGITIYHGDCVDVMQSMTEGHVDITVSSPPYNTIAATTPSGMMAEHNHKQNKGYDGYADDLPELEYQEWMREVFGHCMSVSSGLVWINHKTRYRNKKGIHPLHIFPWSFYSELIWDRKGSITLNARKFAPSHEAVIGFGTPHYWDDDQNTKMSVWQINPETDVKGHPCPFPGRTVRPRHRPDRHIASNLEERLADEHPELIGGQLNPNWIEWYMGFPQKWTDLEDSETR